MAAASILVNSVGAVTGLGTVFRLLPRWMEPLLFNLLLVYWVGGCRGPRRPP